MHPSADELAKVQCDCEKCFKGGFQLLDWFDYNGA